MTPILIALEGIDGAGTTTQLPHLAGHLRRRRHRVRTTCQPSRGPIGRLLRRGLRGQCELPEAALALMFAADRLDHLAREVVPWGAGDPAAAPPVVICDRYLMSSYAYQGSRLPVGWVAELNRLAPPPDITVFFRVSLQTALGRRRARGGPPERFDAAERQAAVASAYGALCAAPGPWGRLLVLDAEAEIAQVGARLTALVDGAMDHLRGRGGATAAGPPRRDAGS